MHNLMELCIYIYIYIYIYRHITDITKSINYHLFRIRKI